MPTTVSGLLNSQQIRNFAGFRIVVSYLERVILPENELAFAPVRRETQANPQGGNFQLGIADAADRQGNVLVQVFDSLGLPQDEKLLPPDGPFASIPLTVRPPQVTDVGPSDDITLSARVKFLGRGIDPKGHSIAAGLTVVLWAKQQSTSNPAPVSVSVTTNGGYFSDIWPTDTYVEAFAIVAGGDPVPVPLENNRIPLRMIIVVNNVIESSPNDEDCGCSDAPPRSQDNLDLATNSAAFSSDLQPCVDFTIPNRTVEEVTYQAVVRTTQPEIKGAPQPVTVPVPQKLLDKLSQLADTRPADPVISLRPNTHIPATGGTLSPVAVTTSGNPVAVTSSIINADSQKIIETVFAKAKSFVPDIKPVNNNTTLPIAPDEFAASVLKERLRNGLPIKLEPSMLTELVREKRDLTPRRLLQAEQTSVVREFRQQVQRLSNNSAGRYALTPQNQINWDELTEFGQAVSIAHGHLLTFKQVWRADGYSLGDLLYSLPLAPGQQKRISILDWSMEQVSSRRASRRVTEALVAELSHDRDIDDIIRASLSEHLDAESHADVSAVGGGIAGFIGSFVFGAAGGVSSAGSTASQTSSRDVSGISMNKLRDRTSQAASAVRSQRATVVQETTQGEAVTAQTEVVANYNHCHALTVEYFEVLRHFQVTQELAHVQECLFIPFSITSFNLSKTGRWKDPLRKFIRNRSMRGAFDAVERVLNNWAQVSYPNGRYADDPINYLEGEFYFRFMFPKPADDENGLFVEANWTGYGVNLLGDSPENIHQRYLGVVLQEQRQQVWDQQIAPIVAQRLMDFIRIRFLGTGQPTNHTVDATLVSSFKQNRPLLVSMRVNLGTILWTRAQIESIRFSLFLPILPAGVRIMIESGMMNYRTDFFAHQLFNNRRVVNDLLVGDRAEISTPLSIAEKRNPKEYDRRVAERLVDHLNEHLEFYHRAIWFAMDPNRRFLLLDGFIAPDAGGRSVASVVENRVIGIVGNCLVMPVAPGQQLDTTYRFADSDIDDLRHLYTADPAPPIRVSVPTSGVFAEAVMGKCNSCEIIDDTKFWRWEEAPIPDQPTLIEPLTTESRRRASPSLAPDTLPDPIVGFQTIPSAVDPTGLAAAVRALGTNNIFKDLTGVALNQANAVNALKSSIKVGQEFATKAGALAQQRFLNKELDRTISQIKSARDKGLITDDNAKELTESALRGAIGEKRPETQPPSKSPEVQKAMKRVPAAKKGSLRVTRPDGTVEVNTDNGSASPRIDIVVDPPVEFLRQTSPDTCWAAGAAMMVSWQNQQSMTIESVIQNLRGDWFNKLQAGEGLRASEFRALMAAIGVVEEAPQSYSPEGLARLLNAKGALLEVGDDSIQDNKLIHVRIITAVVGDGKPEGTKVFLIDTDSGSDSVTFSVFDQRHGGRDVVQSGLGIFHF